ARAGAGVDELAVAYVDAHVADGLAAAGEEDGIAGLQVFVGDRHAVFVYVGGGAVGLIAEALVDVAHKAGAVKAGGGRRTRPAVVPAEAAEPVRSPSST